MLQVSIRAFLFTFYLHGHETSPLHCTIITMNHMHKDGNAKKVTKAFTATNDNFDQIQKFTEK